jgi:diguanylate cyclase (GGDEF)-like protein
LNETAKLLGEYLRDTLFCSSSASLNLDALDEDFRELGEGLVYFAKSLDEQRKLAKALSKGDLSMPPPPPKGQHKPHIPGHNELIAPLKSLHASLRHMTWQTQQVAKGDYRQRVDFMGDFADAFNIMVKQLDARQQALEREIERGREKAFALEQMNNLMTNITYGIPQMIIVFSEDNTDVLFTNKSASDALGQDSTLKDKLMRLTARYFENGGGGYNTGLTYDNGTELRYLSTMFYLVQWSGQNARAMVLNDISDDVERVKALEQHAYQDTLTGLHNRFYGVQVLTRWIEESRCFSLCFADLDNLKYVNDTYGHAEGDIYIKNAACCLDSITDDCITCRLGGDEFMVLIPDSTEAEATERVELLCSQLAETNMQKPYFCRISYGIVEAKEDNDLSANLLLSLADERMYNFKRYNKKTRMK